MNAYNIAFCKPRLEEGELNKIIRSISQREEASEGGIRQVMRDYDVPRDIAIEYILQNPDILDD